MSEAFLVRLKCLRLLAQMPAEGLPELHEDMLGIREFYSERRVVALPPAPKTETVKAKLGKTIVRPEFPIVYEEWE